MNICVTGGSGFIGKKLCSDLVAAGHAVLILTRTPPVESASAPFRYFKADLTDDSASLDAFFADCDVVFHCAGVVGEVEHMRAVHVDGTRRLLCAARSVRQSTGKKIRWVQLSSVGAYGPDQRGDKSTPRIVDESSALAPVGEYECTKTDADCLVLAAAELGDISCVIVRPSNVFGRDMKNQSLRSMASAIRRGLFFYIGKNDAISTYIHVDDVVECLLACGLSYSATGQVFNISNDCMQEDLVKAIASYAGVSAPRIRIPEWLARGIVGTIGKIVSLPLNESRVNALRAKTTYPTAKLESLVGMKPMREVPVYISEIV